MSTPLVRYDLHFLNKLDLRRCLSSGQIFTYVEFENWWAGMDGEILNIFAPQSSETELTVYSTGAKIDVLRHLGEAQELQFLLQNIKQIAPELESVFKSYEGLRMMMSHCPRTTIFSFVCTANNHLSRIYPMIRSLQNYGEVVPIEPQLTLKSSLEVRKFPTLEILAGITEEELRQKGFGYRAKWIPQIARQLTEMGGEMALTNWKSEPYDFVRENLMSLPGIGPKLADCISVFGFGKTEAFPIDTHVYQVAQQLLMPEWSGSPLTNARYKKLCVNMQEKFGSSTALVSHLLFAYNLNKKSSANG